MTTRNIAFQNIRHRRSQNKRLSAYRCRQTQGGLQTTVTIWYDRIVRTDDPIDYWRFATLLGKIADARVLLWSPDPVAGGLIDRFGWSLDKPLNHRFEAWKDKRSKKLFGGDRPREIYLPMRQQVGFEGLE